jgi:TatD DNase family protein
MAYLVDSHCHLDRIDLNQFGGDLVQAIKATQALDVGHMLCVCIDMENFAAVLAIAEQYDCISASVGKHPTEWEGAEPSVEDLVAKAKHPKVVAIGETGLDYFHGKEAERPLQQQRFVRHIHAAKISQKPLIIHTRQAQTDTIDILRAEQVDSAVFHCFTEDWDMAKQGLDLGLYISFSGIVTFKNATSLQEVAKKVPLDRLLVETDSPYLTPVPHRGKANFPGYTRHVAEYIAELRGIPYQQLRDATTENFSRLFKINLR